MSKRILISWMQSLSAVILEPRKIKSDTVSTVPPLSRTQKLCIPMDHIKREIERVVRLLREKGVSENEIRELFEVKMEPIHKDLCFLNVEL